jgi:hypothetical protein
MSLVQKKLSNRRGRRFFVWYQTRSCPVLMFKRPGSINFTTRDDQRVSSLKSYCVIQAHPLQVRHRNCMSPFLATSRMDSSRMHVVVVAPLELFVKRHDAEQPKLLFTCRQTSAAGS